MQQITDNVYVESENSVCNSSFVVTREGVVVIDTPMAPAQAKKWAAVASGYGEVRFVINGEPHTDHHAGNCYFGGTVVAHEGTRELVKVAEIEDLKRMLRQIVPDSLPLDADFKFCPPEITFSTRMTLYLGDHTFHLIHMPGHTPFNLAVYVPEEEVVFTSDNINLGTPFFGDCEPEDWLQSLEHLGFLDVKKVVPGHGEVTDKSCFTRMSDVVKKWRDVVAEAVNKGMSLEEALRKIPEAEMFAGVPKEGPEASFLRLNIERIYRTLSK